MLSDTGERCISALRSLEPKIRALGATIETERRLPEDIVDELKRAGLFHILLPRDFRGLELDPVSSARIVEEASRIDGATGWCLMIAAQCASFAGMLPAAEAKAIWSNGGVVAGTARPIGRAVWTESPEPGYIVSGRWPIASGGSHASWFAAECVVYDGEEVRRDDSGDEVSRMVFVPREAVEVHDTWKTLGLKGTASHDFSIAGAFVPAGRGFQMLVSEPQHPWVLYRSLPLIFINHGAHALGVAHAAIETAVEAANVKRGWGNQLLSTVPAMQTTIAEATALYESAAAYFYDTSSKLWQARLEGRDDPQLSARVRLATSHAASSSVKAIDLLHSALATTAIYSGSLLDRQFRDIHTAAAHVMIGPLTYQAAGRVILGLEAAFPFF